MENDSSNSKEKKEKDQKPVEKKRIKKAAGKVPKAGELEKRKRPGVGDMKDNDSDENMPKDKHSDKNTAMYIREGTGPEHISVSSSSSVKSITKK